MKVKVEQVDIDPKKIIQERGLGSGGRAQKYFEMAVLRYCGPYLPFDKGILEASGKPWPMPGDGYVGWFAPYAHYQHVGEVYGPNIPIKDEDGDIEGWFSPPNQVKHPTGRQLTYSLEKHPQAGSRWVERMMANEGDALLEEMAEYTGGKAKK